MSRVNHFLVRNIRRKFKKNRGDLNIVTNRGYSIPCHFGWRFARPTPARPDPHFGMSTCATKTSRSIEYGTLFRVIIDYDPIRAAGCPIDICQEVQQILEDNLTGMTVQVEHNGVCSWFAAKPSGIFSRKRQQEARWSQQCFGLSWLKEFYARSSCVRIFSVLSGEKQVWM